MRRISLTVMIATMSWAVCAQINVEIVRHDTVATGKELPLRRVLSGHVIDIESGQPVSDAYLMFDDIKFNTTTDATGLFSLLNVPFGRHNLRVTHVAYEPATLSVQIGSTNVVSFDFRLQPRITMLDPVTVTERLNEAQPSSTNYIDPESFELRPGTRAGDLVFKIRDQPGLQSADDSRNDIVVRGNSPQSILWRLEGVSMPNPNHFAFPGTAGGPVTLIHGETLARSEFLSGAFPSRFGNTTSGIFDLRLRKGDTVAYNHSVDFGLLGVTATSEGPLSEAHNSSYLVTTRISTAQVFHELSLDIGIESIPTYWDGSFHLYFPIKSKKDSVSRINHTFRVFGMGGVSNINIVLSQEEDPFSNIYGEKDRDQYFGSDMGILGVVYSKLFRRGELSVTLAGSGQFIHSYHEFVYPMDVRNELKTQDGTVGDPALPPVQRYEFNEKRLSSSILYNTALGESTEKHRAYLQAGVSTDLFFINYRDSARTVGVATTDPAFGSWRRRWWNRESSALIQPFIQYRYIVKDFDLLLGLHQQFFTLNGSASFGEPRVSLQYRLNKKSTLTGGLGFHSQIQPLNLYYYASDNKPNGDPIGTNKDMRFTRSFHAVVGMENRIQLMSSVFRLKSEVYYQRLYNVPVDVLPSSFSLINTGADFRRVYPDSLLVNEGVGYNYGIEATLEKTFSDGYLFFLTGSLFESQYRGSDNVRRGTDFDGNYILNGVLTKQWELSRGRRIFTLGAKFTAVGGRRYGPYDLDASIIAKDVVYVDSERNTLQFRPYYRMDLKAGFQFNRRKASHEFGVDIMNLFNTKNVLRLTYIPNIDTGGKVAEEYQLGFLPFVYYRWEFNTNGVKKGMKSGS